MAAQALQRAFDRGASLDGVLAHLITATAPPAPLPPFEPWRSILSMTFDEFAECGAGLHVTLPKLAEAIWLASDEATQAAVVEATRLWHPLREAPRLDDRGSRPPPPPGGRAHGGPVHRGPRRDGRRRRAS